MALPITKLPSVYSTLVAANRHGSNGVWFSEVVHRESQSEPIDRPLNYFRSVSIASFVYNKDNDNVINVSTLANSARELSRKIAYERAYSKFRDQIRQIDQTAELGVNIVTARQTTDLLKQTRERVKKLTTLGALCSRLDRFAQLLRKFQHRKALALLGKRDSRARALERKGRGSKGRLYARDISQEYLMFHFAWSPLLGDMYALLKQLSEGYSENPVAVKARGSRTYVEKDATITTTGPRVSDSSGRVSYILGCEAQVTDEILFVLNNTGLVNPAVVVWDVIPFSFVVDWFGNFSQQFISPFDTVGVSVTNYYETLYYRQEDSLIWASGVNPQFRYPFHKKSRHFTVNRVVKRAPATPPLRIRNPVTESWRRGLAQISLLTLFGLKPGRRS